MKPPMLKSSKEFSDSMVKFTQYHQWRDVAYTIDGYEILQELGFKDRPTQLNWKREKFKHWEHHGRWNLPTIELLVILFLEDRRIRFVINGEKYGVINSILVELARQTGNKYEPDENTRKYIENKD